MQIQPYLFFNGLCDQAIEFYRKAVGAEVQMLMRYKESPEPCDSSTMPAGFEDKVMHGTLRIGDSTVLVSDGHCEGKTNFNGFSLSLTVPSEADADRAFGALSDGGKVQMPLMKTFFSPRFGMVTDRFGVLWVIYVAPKKG